MTKSKTSDYEWFIEQDLTQYAGEWIAILNKAVVAHNKNVEILIRLIKDKFPHKKPALTKIGDTHRIL